MDIYTGYAGRSGQGDSDFVITGPDEDMNKVVYNSELHRFRFHGETMTLTEVVFTIASQAAQVASESLSSALEKLTQSNDDGKAANEWIRTLNQYDGEDIDADTLNKAADAFKAKYGYDPFTQYDLGGRKSDTYSSKDIDNMNQSTQSYLSTVDNIRQSIQLDVSRYTHVVEEANQLAASVDKAANETEANIINKIG